nr:MOSC domain-containing protein [Amphritea balenae]
MIYPIKSTNGLSVKSSLVTPIGLDFDRKFVLCDKKGRFITARIKPELLNISTVLSAEGLCVSAPGQTNLQIKYKNFSATYRPVVVWGDTINSQHCSAEADQWFSNYLGRPCQLFFFGNESARPLKHYPSQQTAFADGYPLLLISQASLDDLNQRCKKPVDMTQLRPNLVVSDTQAYAEDSWKRIKIGEVEFEITKPCGRCILTTVNTETLQRDPDRQPLSVLKQYRKGSDGEAHFGQNLIAINTGIIGLNDKVEVLDTQEPEDYKSF